MGQNETLGIIVIGVIFLFLLFVYRPWRIRRAARQIISIFQAHNATSAKNAISLEEMGIQPRGMLDAGFKFKDFKKDAFDILLRKGVIETTDDYKFYIPEQTLLRSNFYTPQSPMGRRL